VVGEVRFWLDFGATSDRWLERAVRDGGPSSFNVEGFYIQERQRCNSFLVAV
jgi:hypothetical protein